MAVLGEAIINRTPNHNLLKSLLLVSQQISTLHPLTIVLKKTSTSIIRKSRLFSILFEELLRNHQVHVFPPSAALCFDELYLVLQQVKTLLEECSSRSKLWLLMQIPSVSISLRQVILQLSMLLDIFPSKDLNLNEDVEELVNLIKKQCLDDADYADSHDENLRNDVLTMLENIKREIIPQRSKLAVIFETLNLNDSTSCSLSRLVRYGKCVLYGASTPRSSIRRKQTMAEVNIPADFRCPISLDLMRDPVVVSTGQTYERSSITLWLESGHNTCPKTGQILTRSQLIPNLALKNMIAAWCHQQRIPFQSTGNRIILNKTALEATKMTVSFLVNQLTALQSSDEINRVVHELRVLAKTDLDCRTCIAEAGALTLLVKFLGPEHPGLQVNAVTTILNLSILDSNKTKIMETDGVLDGVVEMLISGVTWESKGNAAATIFSLTGIHAYRKRLVKETRVVKSLVELARDGPTNSKRDAMMAILNLAEDMEAVGKLIEGGVVDMIGDVMDLLLEESMTVLEVVVNRGGIAAISAAYHGNMVKRLTRVLREGTDSARESAAATLVNICRRGGSEMVAELATITGIERVVLEMMGVGTQRGRRKAATLLRILRRWATGQHSATVNMIELPAS